MKSLFDWLTRHGVDCSRTSNEDDALALMIMLALMVSVGMAIVSLWWSGFLTAATICGAGCWIKNRY